MSSVLIGYPTGWTLAVVNDTPRAERAAGALDPLGLRGDDVLVISGARAHEQLQRLGARAGVIARLRRAVQFLAMDQLPDLLVYEAALAEDRALVAVRVPASRRAEVVEVLRGHGAHFINSFGSWMTSEIVPWHGRMPLIPEHMKR